MRLDGLIVVVGAPAHGHVHVRMKMFVVGSSEGMARVQQSWKGSSWEFLRGYV